MNEKSKMVYMLLVALAISMNFAKADPDGAVNSSLFVKDPGYIEAPGRLKSGPLKGAYTYPHLYIFDGSDSLCINVPQKDVINLTAQSLVEYWHKAGAGVESRCDSAYSLHAVARGLGLDDSQFESILKIKNGKNIGILVLLGDDGDPNNLTGSSRAAYEAATSARLPDGGLITIIHGLGAPMSGDSIMLQGQSMDGVIFNPGG